MFFIIRGFGVSIDIEVKSYVPDCVGTATHNFSNLNILELY